MSRPTREEVKAALWIHDDGEPIWPDTLDVLVAAARAWLEPDYEAAMRVRPPVLDSGESESHRFERWMKLVLDAALGWTSHEV